MSTGTCSVFGKRIGGRVYHDVDGEIMALTIKNPETHKLAEELARRTGENLTEAVTTALRERLERIRQPQKGRLAERILAIGKDCAAHLEEPLKSMDVDELLYDQKGPFK